jgi:hypothetical protein
MFRWLMGAGGRYKKVIPFVKSAGAKLIDQDEVMDFMTLSFLYGHNPLETLRNSHRAFDWLVNPDRFNAGDVVFKVKTGAMYAHPRDDDEGTLVIVARARSLA